MSKEAFQNLVFMVIREVAPSVCIGMMYICFIYVSCGFVARGDQLPGLLQKKT